jgi:hypothetical protein
MSSRRGPHCAQFSRDELGAVIMRLRPEVISMLSFVSIVIPAACFVVAAATGVLIRARRAREDKRVRDGFSIAA